MKHSLEHLPARKQRHLGLIVKIIRAAVDAEMIILYGSHARGDWVEDAKGHKFSDYDVLVIVDSEAKVEDVDLWWRLRERLDRAIRPNEVQVIMHGIADVNRKLEDGWYFFVDVEKEGIMLHDSGRHTLAAPQAQDAIRAPCLHAAVLAQRIAVLRERTQAVCEAHIASLGEQSGPA